MTQNTPPGDLAARLDRLESRDEIRQLAAKYALALDMRDMDAMANLFVPDVKVGKHKRGRPALRDWLSDTMRRQFDGTSHHVGGQIIEFTDADHAVGIVYSKNEHETGAEWIIMQMMYHDLYARMDGRWCFQQRQPLYRYAADLNKPSIGSRKIRWPGREPYEGSFHALFPGWPEFWANPQPEGTPIADPAPLERFIDTMRCGASLETVRVR